MILNKTAAVAHVTQFDPQMPLIPNAGYFLLAPGTLTPPGLRRAYAAFLRHTSQISLTETEGERPTPERLAPGEPVLLSSQPIPKSVARWVWRTLTRQKSPQPPARDVVLIRPAEPGHVTLCAENGVVLPNAGLVFYAVDPTDPGSPRGLVVAFTQSTDVHHATGQELILRSDLTWQDPVEGYRLVGVFESPEHGAQAAVVQNPLTAFTFPQKIVFRRAALREGGSQGDTTVSATFSGEIVGAGVEGVVGVYVTSEGKQVAVKLTEKPASPALRRVSQDRPLVDMIAELPYWRIGSDLVPTRTFIEVMSLAVGLPVNQWMLLPTFPVVKRYLKGVGEVLEYLDRKGIQHRDLHEGNQLVTDEGDVRVLDLGLASVRGDVISWELPMCIRILPPEFKAVGLVPGEAVDYDPRQHDLWAAGITALQFITGHQILAEGTYADFLARYGLRDVPLGLVPEPEPEWRSYSNPQCPQDTNRYQIGNYLVHKPAYTQVILERIIATHRPEWGTGVVQAVATVLRDLLVRDTESLQRRVNGDALERLRGMEVALYQGKLLHVTTI